ncbi:hypothetical protein PV396_41870 [Streptomyces sp. ME02-8801-2C]|uniref:DUF6907 domain-containing protein n=1 Tax=Streptomyces sp. ME02-8801-2C TaxID=3028680 RepID=UPI0029AE8D77|nr:hypothetical protein [Streptomyces sp. ME02-8801-2C]MDX3458413.1 hypothetical protein [Streptomyces sp. ME02-8801-2C]
MSKQSMPRPAHRMVPAVVGWPGRQTTVLIEDPDWCNIDHVDLWVHALEDVDHYSDFTGWSTDSILQPGDAVIELLTRVHSDPLAEDAALRDAHVIIDDGHAGSTCYLTPEMAERAADELIAMAADVRRAAQAARQSNALAGRQRRNRSQADESLRRVRGGQA